jgi:diketogulonate reductase-like aldo/keto reductase
VETSLRELQTDRVDALLLHECGTEHVTDELKRMLERLQAEGKIVRWGIASTPPDTLALMSHHPDLCGIVQVSAGAQAPLPAGARLIVHSVLTRRLPELASRLSVDAALARRFSSELGVDPGDRAVLARLLLQLEMRRRPDAVVLFSTHSCKHIQRNASLLTSPDDAEALGIFAALAGDHAECA